MVAEKKANEEQVRHHVRRDLNGIWRPVGAYNRHKQTGDAGREESGRQILQGFLALRHTEWLKAEKRRKAEIARVKKEKEEEDKKKRQETGKKLGELSGEDLLS